jgi:hypothetical protein
MTEMDVQTSHLEPARADAARRARDVLFDAAATWALASKNVVGTVELPADRSAAVAFDAFFGARRELAHHMGAEAARVVAAEALCGEPSTTTDG